MSPALNREQIGRIRRRHRGYILVLLTISLLLLLQPVAQRWPLLNPVGAITLSLVMMLFLTRYSPLLARKRLSYGLGIAAIASELLWLLGLETHQGLAIHLGIAHLLIWSLFIGVFLLRKVRAPLHAFPSMVMASFGALTTTGAAIGRPGDVLASTGCLAITIVGQLYVAVLIALILGRFHRRGAA